jgi:ABC-2 type transport system permease protein
MPPLPALSSLFENPVVATVVSIAALLALYFLPTAQVLVPTSALFSFIVCLLAAAGVGVLMWHTTKNITIGLLIAALLITAASVTFLAAQTLFDALIVRALTAVNLFTRFAGFSYGHLDLPATIFYLTFIGVFLFLTVQIMEKRRRA